MGVGPRLIAGGYREDRVEPGVGAVSVPVEVRHELVVADAEVADRC